jgi:histone H3/H4
VWNFLAIVFYQKDSKDPYMKSSELGLSAMYRILKKAGAERVSDESADELRRVLEDIATTIATSAVDMSNHAGRKTIRGEDVKLASKSFVKS